ncbi:MAG: hypothetical protein HY763_02755 [Planctomycetes bacterium]|nr:hypothetical protein [Planctomycetota bacterium]
MNALASLALLVTLAGWCIGWRLGERWCRACGVYERFSRWALACIVPCASLVAAVHAPATVALLTRRGVVTIEVVACVFMMMLAIAHRLTRSAAGRAAASSEPSRHPASPPEPPVAPRWYRTPWLIVLGLYLVFVVEALTRYPTGYDGMYYHLPLAVRWMQTGMLGMQNGEIYYSLPENGILWSFLLVSVPLERLLPLVNVPNAVILAAAVYALTRVLGAGRRAAGAAVCMALSVPVVLFQSFAAYVDLYGAVAWLLALLALTWHTRVTHVRQRRDLLILAGLSAGVALGSKSTYLALVGLLLLLVLALDWIRPRDRAAIRGRPVRNAMIFGLASLACSGFWFLRGTVEAGNPIYPFGVSVAGRQVLPGFNALDHCPARPLGRKIARWWAYPWEETKYSGTGYPYSVNNALGAAYTTFVPAAVLAVALAFLRRRPRDPAERWTLVYLLFTLAGIVLLLTLFTEILRYVLPLVLLAVPLGGMLFDRLVQRSPRPAWALLSITLVITATIAAYKPAASMASRWRHGDWSRDWFYQIPPPVGNFDPGSRIVNLAPPELTYPLLGADFRNVVIPKPVWDTLDNGGAVTAAALLAHNIDYVVVQEPFPPDWPADLPLELIYDDSTTRPLPTTPATRIYRVAARTGEHMARSGP